MNWIEDLSSPRRTMSELADARTRRCHRLLLPRHLLRTQSTSATTARTPGPTPVCRGGPDSRSEMSDRAWAAASRHGRTGHTLGIPCGRRSAAHGRRPRKKRGGRGRCRGKGGFRRRRPRHSVPSMESPQWWNILQPFQKRARPRRERGRGFSPWAPSDRSDKNNPRRSRRRATTTATTATKASNPTTP